jgi:hypothetical protein
MKFVIQDDVLIVELEGLEKLWALKSRMQVPRLAILEVDYLAERPVMQDFRGYLRIPGTGVPWRFFAGTFWRKGDREFWFVRMKLPGVMTIELKAGTFLYRRIRVSCDAETAQVINDWWREGKHKI